MGIHTGAEGMSRPRLTRQRRMEILEAAVEVIGERGLCETRIVDVARRAGSSAALVLYYFQSKDRLLTEALAHAEDRFYLRAFHQLTAFARARDRLVHLIDLSLPPGTEERDTDWTLWIELWSRSVRDPEVARRREALDRRWRTTIAEIVREGQRAGEFQDVDVEAFSLRLASLTDGLAIQVVMGDPECTAERARQVCLDLAAQELGFDRRSDRPHAPPKPRAGAGAPRGAERRRA